MRRLQIGSVAGIPIRLDPTFLLVLPVFAYLIGSQSAATAALLNDVWGADIPAGAVTGGATPWVLGTVAALALFFCVVLHELGHSFVAMYYGYEIESITLWLLGGVASFTEMPEDWKQELSVALAGPAVSVALGVVCYAGFHALPATLGAARFLAGYLALLNVSLAVFNMLPGFPMDGGRVLRALLARTRPYPSATRIAASVGKGFALLLGVFGVVSFNLFLIAIAFFIYIGATGEVQQQVLKSAFEGYTVRDVMTPLGETPSVEPGASVADLLERMVRERTTEYAVVRNGRVVGLVTLDGVSAVAPVERDALTVADVMATELETVPVDALVTDALTGLGRGSPGWLFVTDGAGSVVGALTREDVMRAFTVLSRSGAGAPAVGPNP
jgi:Zn-dependent protease/CBS domain-containing protein